MKEIAERIENNFINIHNKFDILDKKIISTQNFTKQMK